jgi:hypothetical protein
MTNNISRGVPESQSSARRTNPWFGTSLTVITVVLATIMSLSGCDKPPTFSELINGKKKEAPPTAPPPVAKSSTPTPPAEPAKPPEKPKRAPQEVLAEYNSTPYNQHTDAQIRELASTPEAADQITEIYVASSPVSDAGMAFFPKFEHVEKLTVDNCQFTNAALANVAKMKSLTSFSMGGAVMREPCDAGLASIKEMHQLTSLSLDSTNVTPKGLEHVAQMEWLESLNVAHTRFNDDNLKILAPLKNLKSLNIAFTMVSDNGFEGLLPFHELETLNIARTPIRGEGFKELGRRKAFPNLRNLVMFSIAGLELSGYEGIYSFRQTLESLDIGQSALTDDRFTNAITKCPKLETLLVHENPGLTDAGISQIFRLKSLKKLYFYKNPGISDGSLPWLAKLRKLESLTMNATSVSENGARALKKKMKTCEIVYNYKKIE